MNIYRRHLCLVKLAHGLTLKLRELLEHREGLLTTT